MSSNRLHRVMVAALTLIFAQCATPNVADSDVVRLGGGEMELYARTASRTSNDGINTLWSEGDRINIFHLASNSDHYINDGAFTLTDGSQGCFKGNLNSEGSLINGTTYDWFASYPYNATLTSPNGEETNFTIGSSPTSHQIQTGNNNSAHMAGEYMPLVGKVSGVAADKTPSLAMKNVASMIKFVITNNFDEAFTIKSIEFTTPNHSLVGSFSIDFSDVSAIRYTPVAASDRAVLEVANGENIAVGESAAFYMAIVPFTAALGEQITFKVNILTSQGERGVERAHTLANNLTFSAGKRKDITLKCGEELEVVKLPLEELPPMTSDMSILRSRILCYNIRNCKGSDNVVDYQRVAGVIRRCNADVVALQEVDSMTTRYPGIDVSKRLGDLTGHHATYGAAIKYTTGKYGVAVLSKEKPKSWRTVKLPCSNEERVLLIVEFEEFYFCSTHFSLLEEYRLKAVDIITEEASKLNKPVIIAGDLNALPESSVLSGLRKNFEVFEKSGSPLTFPASAPNREIDYVAMYKTPHYYPIVYEHYVVNAPIESDHRPILASVELFKRN